MGLAVKALQVALHPTELGPLVRMYLCAARIKKLPHATQELEFCYGMLPKVGRSFAVVIQQLPEELRDAVCVFYLVLRALDTIEDDMAFPNQKKLPLLRSMHKSVGDAAFARDDCGENEAERELLRDYGKVAAVFNSLLAAQQAAIRDICARMGAGMADFIERDVKSVKDYDLYCHYVAGLVGIGLCHLFAASGCEAASFEHDMDDLANHMGLFLQKTNIIRDYLEDINELPAPRMFWPQDIWGHYAERLDEFKDAGNREQAVKCLNHMVTNALSHAPHCLEYMQHLQHTQVFAFCAIPQIMAIATLATCYDNHRVFEGVVKLRRGQTAAVFDRLRGKGSLYQHFHLWTAELHDKAARADARGDPTAAEARSVLVDVAGACEKGTQAHGVSLRPASKLSQQLMLVTAFVYFLYAINAPAVREWLGAPTTDTNLTLDYVQPVTAFVITVVSFLKLVW